MINQDTFSSLGSILKGSNVQTKVFGSQGFNNDSDTFNHILYQRDVDLLEGFNVTRVLHQETDFSSTLISDNDDLISPNESFEIPYQTSSEDFLSASDCTILRVLSTLDHS